MNEEYEYIDEEDVLSSVNRYEAMLEQKAQLYFDVFEFENIINFYLDHNKINTAFEVANYASKQHPSSITIQQVKAQVLIDKGRRMEALKILKKLASIEPSNYENFFLEGMVYSYLGDIKESIRKFEHALKLAEDDRQSLLHSIAIAFEQVGQFEISIRYLKQALKFSPDSSSIIYDLAYCYEKIDDNDQSIKYYTRYINEFPFAETAWYNLGVVFNKKGELEKAIDAYDFALAIDDQFSSALFNKGNIYASQGKYESAIFTYHTFLEIEKDSPHALCYIGECYERLEKYHEALKYYKKAIVIDPQFAEAWYGIGIVLIYSDKISESITFIKKAIKLDNENPGYWYTIGNIYAKQNKFKNAKFAYKKALEVDPFHFEYWLAYAHLYFTSENIRKSLRILKEASQYISKNAYIHYRLSAYFFAAAKPNHAYSHLKTALLLDSSCFAELFDYYPQAKLDAKVNEMIDQYL